MNLKKLVEDQSLTNFPVGLGGCRTTSSFFDSCDYDITIFDNKSELPKIIKVILIFMEYQNQKLHSIILNNSYF